MTTLWPTLTVADVDASIAFYSDRLGFKPDLRLQDHRGRTYLGSVEVGDTVLMFEARDRLAPSAAKPGAGCGIRLTILLPQGHDIDAYYSELLAKNVPIACEIGNRFWGNRDFTISDPDEYHLTLAKQIRA
jgi:uncharacterized glyoxalase superfamily protein PhnB